MPWATPRVVTGRLYLTVGPGRTQQLHVQPDDRKQGDVHLMVTVGDTDGTRPGTCSPGIGSFADI